MITLKDGTVYEYEAIEYIDGFTILTLGRDEYGLKKITIRNDLIK